MMIKIVEISKKNLNTNEKLSTIYNPKRVTSPSVMVRVDKVAKERPNTEVIRRMFLFFVNNSKTKTNIAVAKTITSGSKTLKFGTPKPDAIC
jgi:hypothetical protein